MTENEKAEAAAIKEALRELDEDGRSAYAAMMKEFPGTPVDIRIAMVTLMAGVARQGTEIARCHTMLDGVAQALRGPGEAKDG